MLSGEPAAIDDALRRLTEREIFCRRIKVDVASHCSQMDPLRPELEAQLSDIHPRVGEVPLYSTSGGGIEDGSRLNAGYWGRNLRQPVLFSGAVDNLLRDGFDTFIEINAHPVLLQSIESSIGNSGRSATAVASLRRGQNDRAEMLNALGALYVSGFPVDFSRLYPRGACLRLPPATWDRERYWIETDGAQRQPRRLTAVSAPAPASAQDIYELHWHEAEVPSAKGTAGLWIVMGGGEPVAVSLMTQMESAGNFCFRVRDEEGLERALIVSGGRCRGVIRISTTESADARDAAAEAMQIVRTVRTVAAAAGAPRLWLVSTGAWHLEADGGEVQAAQSTGWGLGRVVEREYPELHPANADLSASPEGEEIEILARLICANGPEEQVAVRGGKYFVARYERMAHQTGGAVAFHADASYLITGGLGGIGPLVAEWLARNGAKHIALVGRRLPDDAAGERIAALQSTAEVRVFSADMAEEDQVRAMLAAMHAEMPPLKGVFHLAAAYESALLGNVEPSGLYRVMRSKAEGAWALDRCLDGIDLDYFVLFSSIAAAIGQPGLGSYAAANAYVEGLARHRRARGLKAQSIQWGSWLSTGLSNDQHVRDGVRIYRAGGDSTYHGGRSAARAWKHYGGGNHGRACATRFLGPVRP